MTANQEETIGGEVLRDVEGESNDLRNRTELVDQSKMIENGTPDGVDLDPPTERSIKVTRKRVKQRRGQRYQKIEDFIREKSPPPGQQHAMKSIQGDAAEKQDKGAARDSQNECGDSNNQQQGTTQPIDKPADSLPSDPNKEIEFKRADEKPSSTERPKDYRCDHCGKSYAHKSTFEQHIRTHTEGRPKCPECTSTFASAFSLFRHRAKAHNLEHSYTTHHCYLCDKTFFSASELNLHIQRHYSRKVHSCPECEKSFAAKGNLRIHMRTHAKEKLYHCDICSSTFSHPYSLVSHRRIHTNELPYTCPECGKHYRSKHQLKSHMNVHSDNCPYACDQCTKKFKSRTGFRMHQDKHKGIKRFVCKVCDRKFQCQANMAKHERRHFGVKRFSCDQCDKAFIEKQELMNHRKVHDRPSPSTKTPKTTKTPKSTSSTNKNNERAAKKNELKEDKRADKGNRKVDKPKKKLMEKKTANLKVDAVEARTGTRHTRAKRQKQLQDAETVPSLETSTS